ncbi:MAG: hypothetical protein ACE147_16190 [Candidatus Methylomirabilales bacterium]
MWVRLLPPFGDGKSWREIDLPARASVAMLIQRLAQLHAELHPYLRETPDETFHHFILARGDYVLRADDVVEPEDRIVVVMPLTGG